MSDRMINLFIKELKRANDGLMPDDKSITIWTDAEEFTGVLARCDDTAGVVILENRVPAAKIKRTGPASATIEEGKPLVYKHFIRYDKISAISVKT